MNEATPDILVNIIKERFTALKPCVVGGDDDEATDPHTVWLTVGVQSFCLEGYRDTKEDAEWMRLMLAKAIAAAIRELEVR